MTTEEPRGDDHEFLQRLSAADPVDQNRLPSATDPQAQQILEQAMSSESPDLTGQPVPTAPPAVPVNGPISVPTNGPIDVAAIADDGVQVIGSRPAPAPRPRGRSRGRGMLIASAAAVLVLLGGLLVFLPDNTPSAVATVQAAAAAAADADTGRIETNVSISGTDGVEFGSVDANFLAAYADSNLSVTFDLGSDVPGDPGFTGLTDLASEVLLIGDVVYVDIGGQWLAIDTDGLLGDLVVDVVDPRSVLETVQTLTEATEVGSATVDGVDTTQFQSVIDLSDESLRSSGWLGFEGTPIEAEGEVTVDLFIDDAGLLRQFDLTGDISDPDGGPESGTFDVSTRFFDIGGDIELEAPADAIPFDPLSGEGLEGLFGN